MKKEIYNMDLLKLKLTEILNHIEDKNDVVYLDYPLHYNVGDLLIFLGGIQFLSKNEINVKKFYCVNNLKINNLKKNITKKTTILCHGGGNFGDIYENHQKLREDIVKNFPNNKIIILPQTAYFKDKENQNRSEKLFSNHKNLIIFARDCVSLEIFKKHSNHCFLMPDMAHFLYKNIPEKKQPSKSVLLFLRKDVEACVGQEKISGFENHESYDWADLIDENDELQLKKIKKLIKLNKLLNSQKLDDYIFRQWNKNIEKLVERSIEFFLDYEKIVTSRLHGHIMTCLLDRKSIVLNNSYGKNKSYYDLWTNDIAEFLG